MTRRAWGDLPLGIGLYTTLPSAGSTNIRATYDYLATDLQTTEQGNILNEEHFEHQYDNFSLLIVTFFPNNDVLKTNRETSLGKRYSPGPSFFSATMFF